MSQRGEHFMNAYRDLLGYGVTVTSRGKRTLEIENYQLKIPPMDYCTSFNARRFNLDYARAEWAWYLQANPHARWIERHASMWPKLHQDGIGYLSNYGQYLFLPTETLSKQAITPFEFAARSLVRDPGTRQAVIPFLRSEHLYENNPDLVCTSGVQFRLREGRLNMTVMMRSNDAIFGMTNDVFCFGQLHMMMHARLSASGVKAELGDYTHFATSFHVYESFWPMLERLVDEDMNGHSPIRMPPPAHYSDFAEIIFPLSGSQSPYARWILEPLGKDDA